MSARAVQVFREMAVLFFTILALLLVLVFIQGRGELPDWLQHPFESRCERAERKCFAECTEGATILIEELVCAQVCEAERYVCEKR